ncbi:hypothetical protein E4T48_05079 [Aureobasidium sp. EXF-10727]|nr:hypothetical protein E4T48_05079 [Aureobasidium sp. EXF-10727]
MAALVPDFSTSNGGSHAPTTPRGQASKEINTIIESIAQEFSLPLKPRIGTSSPSKRPDVYPERCVDHIKFLFFRNRIVMHDVINQFRKDRDEDCIHGDLLEAFYTRTREAFYLEMHKPQLGKLRLDEPTPQPDARFRKPAPKLSWTQTKLIPTIKKTSNSSRVKAVDTENQSPPDKLLPADQLFLFDRSPDTRGTKRLSDQDSCSSSKYVRPQKQRRQQPSLDDHFSCKISPSNPSFTSSVQTNTASVYPGHADQSFATTVADSFDGQHDDSDSSSAEYGAGIDPSQADRLLESIEGQPPTDSGVANIEKLVKCQYSTDGRSHTNSSVTFAELHARPASFQPRGDHAAATKVPSLRKTTSRSNVLEHRLVRTLPTNGLFGSPVAINVNQSSFHHLWESYRLANTVGTPFQYHANEDELYQNIPAGAQFQRTPASLWDATTDPTQSANVMLKANLNLNPSASADKLLNLSLQPLKCERACVLQRRFGPSRFLYIEVPQIHTFNAVHLKGQQDLLRLRFLEWMRNEKEFLGRIWRVFHIQDVKKKHSKDNLPSYRLVLFAVDGPRLQKISINEVLDWAIPFAKNGYQGFCKAYARLDLFLSQTIPTVNFNNKEVRYVKDILADGTLESVEFNDRRMKFEYRSGPSDERAVMNDGCSLISVAAAKELCEILGIKGVRPVAFQGRINGCKGVWMISAPYDTTETKHLRRWIQLTESQRKVMPRDEDFTNNCEPDRWSFELVKYTSPPKSSTLNLDFIPILQNRHVSRDTLRQVIETQLEMDFSAFFESLNDPITLRRWLHSEFSGMEELNRKLGIREAGNFPSDWVEKSILLLESGFNPLTNQYLATCIQQVAKLWLSSLRSKLKIHLGKSAMALGVADPTGCLKPGEIHMAFSETFRDEVSGEVWSHLKGEVLVARHPSLRCSDVQKVRAVYKEELSHLTDVVVFPSKGCVPLAHKLQGGDYDGDTFWLCWDPRLTTDFRNAPAPVKEPELEYYGIKKDTRTLRSVLGQDNNVDAWLSEAFKFKLQEDLLGKATKMHGKLAYKENSISSKKVEDLAGLHDLVIDSAKNGYTLTLSAFNDFVRKKLGIKGPLYKPAYESWMEPTTDTTIGRLEPNLKHIIDYLLFEVVNPRIERLTKDCQEKLADAESYDEDLIKLYQDRQADNDSIIVDVLRHMTADLKNVNYIGNSAEKMTKDLYTLQAHRVLEAYTAVQPIHTEDRIVQEWLKRTTPNSPNTWELLKASAFYLDKHKHRLTLAFLVAGKELCYIKAMARSGSRVTVEDLYAIYKPKKEKKVINKHQVPLPITESSESSEEEFFDAPG